MKTPVVAAALCCSATAYGFVASPTSSFVGGIVLHAHGPKQLQEARCLRCNPHVEGNSLLVSNACSTVTHASVASIIVLHCSSSGKLAAAAAAAAAACE
eukprot:6477-Heterococcus_DN1.PRE.1